MQHMQLVLRHQGVDVVGGSARVLLEAAGRSREASQPGSLSAGHGVANAALVPQYHVNRTVLFSSLCATAVLHAQVSQQVTWHVPVHGAEERGRW